MTRSCQSISRPGASSGSSGAPPATQRGYLRNGSPDERSDIRGIWSRMSLRSWGLLRCFAKPEPLLQIVKGAPGERAFLRQILFCPAQAPAVIPTDAPGERGKQAEIHVHRLIGARLGTFRVFRSQMTAGDVREQGADRS